MAEKNAYYLIIFENKKQKERFREVCRNTGVSMQLMLRKTIDEVINKSRRIDLVS